MSCWQLAGMPVMGSRRVLSWAMDHEGEMRRSDDVLAEQTSRGTSAAGWRDMMASFGMLSLRSKTLEAGVGRGLARPEKGSLNERPRQGRGLVWA